MSHSTHQVRIMREGESAVLAAAARLARPGDPLSAIQVATEAGIGEHAARNAIARLTAEGRWPYRNLTSFERGRRGSQNCTLRVRAANDAELAHRIDAATEAKYREHGPGGRVPWRLMETRCEFDQTPDFQEPF